MPWGRKSHFFCTVDGAPKRQARIAGDQHNGINAVLAGWKGAIDVRVYHSYSRQADHFTVSFIPWHKSESNNGRGIVIAEGLLDYDVLGPKLESEPCLVRLDADVLAALEFVRAKQIMMEGIDTQTI